MLPPFREATAKTARERQRVAEVSGCNILPLVYRIAWSQTRIRRLTGEFRVTNIQLRLGAERELLPFTDAMDGACVSPAEPVVLK